MENDDGSDIYYETTDDSSIVPCTILQSQLWLLQGYLTSTSRFALSEKNMRRSEWKTLEELMEQNGREIPFVECSLNENEKKEQEEELQRLKEEMAELKQLRESARLKLLEFREKSDKMQKVLKRLAHLAPIRNTRSTQTVVNLSSVISGVLPPGMPRQIMPQKGVDPFALLKSCARAKRLMHGQSVSSSFKQLRAQFDRCDKQKLVQLTRDIFPVDNKLWKICTFCGVKLPSSSTFMEHILSVKHIAEMQSLVCADAFDFWSNVVERATEKSTVPKTTASNSSEPPKRSDQGASAIDPPKLPALSVLRRDEKVDWICRNPKDELAKMHTIFKTCDKKKLDNDPKTMSFFTKPLLCLICNRCAIDKASNFVAHITGYGHVEMVLADSCPVSQVSIDFWMRALQKASKGLPLISHVTTPQTSSNVIKNPLGTASGGENSTDSVEKEEAIISKFQSLVIEEKVEGRKEKKENTTTSVDWYDGWSAGDRCEWKGEMATVRWIGTLKSHDEVCAGLEFDNSVGQGTGMYQGTELFSTQSDHAGFVKLFEITRMKGKAESIAEHEGWRVGRRCIWKRQEATIRWIGKLEGHTGVYAGLAFDDAVGQGTGQYQGMELFRTSNGHAGFVLLSSLMGNGESRSLAAARLRRPLNAPDSVKKLSTLSWDEFAACVRSVNAKCRGLVNEQKEYFVFCIRHGAVQDEGWKDHLQMICVATHTETGQYRFVRAYSLQRFLNIHHAFSMIPEVANVPTPLPTMTDSIFVTDGICSDDAPESSQSSSKPTDTKTVDEKSCCICFDREADTILSCTHSFCTVCVATWSEYRTQFQCPLCKAAIRSPLKDSWELMSEQPTRAEMEGYFTSLMSQREAGPSAAIPTIYADMRSASPAHSSSECS